MTIDTLPWDAVTSDTDQVPFEALEQIATALPQDPAVLDRLSDIYVLAQERHLVEGGFEFIYIPGIIAFAAESFSGDLLEYAITLLMDWLDKTDEGADLDFEILTYTMEALGPAALPYVVKRLRERDPLDSQCFYLRGLLDRLAKTDDPALREPAVEYCRETIDAAIAGNFDADLTIEQARALVAGSEPHLRDKLEALERICREESPQFSPEAIEFRNMMRVLNGEGDFASLLGDRHRPVREWITQYHEMTREWRLRDDAGRDDDNDTDEFFASPLLDRSERDHPQPIVREQPKVGRNDPCICGSGKKHKKCCGR